MAQASQNIARIINKFRQELQKLNICPVKIILYGSFVLNKQRKDSDIDLIVISDDFQNLNIRERLEILGLAAGRIMEPIEAFGYTQQEADKETEGSFLWDVLNVQPAIEVS